MNRIFVIAMLLGVSAALLHFFYMRKMEQQLTGGKAIPVVVTNMDLKPGDLLNDKSLAVRSIPINFVDKRAVRQSELKELIGVPMTVAVSEGQVLQWTDIQSRNGGEADDLADYVESGKRAMTIVVNNELAFGGLLKPGHRVDILGTFSKSVKGVDAQTRILLQNITVLATGDRLAGSKGDAGFGTVTLSVDLEQGELLAFADELGELSLVLRGREDVVIASDVPAKSAANIFSLPTIQENRTLQFSDSEIERLQVRR